MQRISRPFKVLLILVVSICSDYANASSSPTVHNGVLDLRNWNSQINPQISLEGEWKFYWDQHIEPSTYNGNLRSQASTAPVPGRWSELVAPGAGNQKLPSHGKATYTLDIAINPNTPKNLSISLSKIGTSYKLFALSSSQSMLIGDMGRPGDSEPTSIAKMQNRTVSLPPLSQGNITLLIQVSNFVGPDGGMMGTPTLGLTQHVEASRDRKSIGLFLCLGALLMLCLSQVLSLVSHPKSRVHRALTCLTFFALVFLALRGNLFHLLDPTGETFSFQRLHRLEFILLSAMLPCLALLYRPHLIRDGREKTLLASFVFTGTSGLFALLQNIHGVINALPYLSILLSL